MDRMRTLQVVNYRSVRSVICEDFMRSCTTSFYTDLTLPFSVS